MKKEYHLIRKRQADFRALLRFLVAGYLLTLALQLLTKADDPSFPPAARLAVGVLFAGGAAGFALYTWRQYQADRRAAELTEEELEEAGTDSGDDP